MGGRLRRRPEGRSFKKVAGIVTKAGAQVRKRFNGWAELDRRGVAHCADRTWQGSARGDEGRRQGDGRGLNAAPASPSRTSPWPRRRSRSALLRLALCASTRSGNSGRRTRLGGAHITTALDALYPATTFAVHRAGDPDLPDGQRGLPARRLRARRRGLCSAASGYGKKGLYQDQDFECSPARRRAPSSSPARARNSSTSVPAASSTIAVLLRRRASWAADRHGARLVARLAGGQCQPHELHRPSNGYVANGNAPNYLVAGLWRLYFSFTGNVFIWVTRRWSATPGPMAGTIPPSSPAGSTPAYLWRRQPVPLAVTIGWWATAASRCPRCSTACRLRGPVRRHLHLDLASRSTRPRAHEALQAQAPL